MKTLIKLQLTAAIIALAFVAKSQTSQTQKASVAITIAADGKTLIDTSFNGMDEKELLKALAGMAQTGNLKQVMDSSHKFTICTHGGSQIMGGGNGNGQMSLMVTADKKDSNKVTLNFNWNDDSTKVTNVYVIDAQTLSDADKAKLPAEVADALPTAQSFENLNLYPNPSGGIVHISYHASSTEPLYIHIYDEQGGLVYTQQYTDATSEVNKTLSFSKLDKGVYFVQLSQGNQAAVRKLIVQ